MNIKTIMLKMLMLKEKRIFVLRIMWKFKIFKLQKIFSNWICKIERWGNDIFSIKKFACIVIQNISYNTEREKNKYFSQITYKYLIVNLIFILQGVPNSMVFKWHISFILSFRDLPKCALSFAFKIDVYFRKGIESLSQTLIF